jgi:hypothetical protein
MNLLEAYRKHIKEKDCPNNTDESFSKHYEKFDYIKSNITVGNLFLYEKVSYRNDAYTISYPRLAIHINHLICDQALEIEYYNIRRTNENNIYETRQIDNVDYKYPIADLQSMIDSTILWYDNLLIYGVWDHKPNYKELKIAYEKTWWYHRSIEELRDLTINRLLK